MSETRSTKATSAARPVRFAVVQFESNPPSDHSTEPSQKNLAKAHDFVREASEAGANVVVFPEYFLSGVMAEEKHWGLAQPPHDTHQVDPVDTEGDVPQHWLESFRLLAVKHNIDIVAGTIVEKSNELKEDGNPALHNVAHYITRQGDIVGRYAKRNLWIPEVEYLTEGKEDHQVFETEWGRTGMLICWDMAWPEAFRSLLLQRAEIIICPTFWSQDDAGDIGTGHNPNSEALYLDSLMVTRAFEHECCVVFVNCGGKASEGYIGRSGVTVPFKGFLGQTKSSEEELLIVDVDLSILEDAKSVYQIRKGLLPKMKQWGHPIPEGVAHE